MGLEDWIERLTAIPDRGADAELLRGAQQLVAGGATDEIRERARRASALTPQAIRVLTDESTDSHDARELLAVTFVLAAAATGQGDAFLRLVLAGRLADVALHLGLGNLARDACVDARESVAILNRFFHGDPEQITQWQKHFEAQMSSLRPQGMPDSAFEYPQDDLVLEWRDAVLWNLDFDSNAGLTDQGDAIARLARRFLAYGDTNPQELAAAVRQLATECTAIPDEPKGTRVRCFMTIGNALYDADEWLLGARIHAQAQAIFPEHARDPFGWHFAVQEAFGLTMAGELDAAQARIDAVDADALRAGSELIVACAADEARYWATRQRLFRSRGDAIDAAVEARIVELVERVSIIASHAPERTAYIRNLFFAMLHRDLWLLRSGTGDST